MSALPLCSRTDGLGAPIDCLSRASTCWAPETEAQEEEEDEDEEEDEEKEEAPTSSGMCSTDSVSGKHSDLVSNTQPRPLRAPLGRSQGALARGGAIGGRKAQLLIQRDLPLEGPHGRGAPRKVLTVVCMSVCRPQV